MRADIAATNQGIRNVNDAISLLQTMDGALSIIDEKLIRLKELAEQAATGSYDSVQRLMIDSEFQMMASEIERIAQAADWNGIKLLDGEFEVTSSRSGSSSSTSSTSSTSSSGTFSGAVTSASFHELTGIYNSTISFDDTSDVRDNTSLTVQDIHVAPATLSSGEEIQVTLIGNAEEIAALPDDLQLHYYYEGPPNFIWVDMASSINFDNLNSSNSSAIPTSSYTDVPFYFSRTVAVGETITISNIHSVSDKDDFGYTVSGDYPNASVLATKNGNKLDLDISLDGTHTFTHTIDFGSSFGNSALCAS